MHKMPFVWRSKTRSEANSSISQTLTLNVFFDDHYFPHIKVSKKETKHDWSIYNKHMRAQLGRYLIVDLTNPVLDVWVHAKVNCGWQSGPALMSKKASSLWRSAKVGAAGQLF